MSILPRGVRVRRAGLAAAAVVLLLVPAGCAFSLLHPAHSGPVRLGEGRCKPGPALAGVYLPFRLHVKRGCMTVTGVVDCLRHEDDGDIHFELRVDRRYSRLLTPANAFQKCPGHPGPHLVVEIIPQRPHLPFLTNSATLGGFVTPAAPRVGDRVTVTGPYVWDTNALHDLVYPGKNVANWAEIHPAWNVTVDHRPG